MDSQEVKVTEAPVAEEVVTEVPVAETASGIFPNKVYRKNPLHLAFLIALGALACTYIANTVMYIISMIARFASPDAAVMIRVTDVVERMVINIPNEAGEIVLTLPVGYAFFTLVSAVIPTFLVIAFINALKLYRMETATSIEVDGMRRGFDVLKIFSIFTIVDSAFATFAVLLGIFRAKTNLAFLNFTFKDFFDITVDYDFKSVAIGWKPIVIAVLVFACIIAYAILQMMTYSKYSEYLSAASRATDSGNPVTDVKPPFITAFILAAINVFIAVVMFMSGHFVTGAINVCRAAMFVISAIYLTNLQKKIG